MKKNIFLFQLFLPLLLLAQNTGSHGSVDLLVTGLTNTDSVSIIVWDHLVSESKRMILPHRILTKKTIEGGAAFNCIKISDPVYFSLVAGRYSNNEPKELLRLYLAEPGDSVKLDLSDSQHPLFSGRGIYKYHFKEAFDSLAKAMSLQFQQRHSKYTLFKQKKWFAWQQVENSQSDSLFDQGVRLLKTYRKKISPVTYAIFYGNLVGLHTETNYNNFAIAERSIRAENKTTAAAESINQLYRVFKKANQDPGNIFPMNRLRLSTKYIHAQVLLIQAALKQGGIKSMENAILNNYPGSLKEAVLSCWITNDFDMIPGADSVLFRAIKTIKDTAYQNPLLQLSRRLASGTPAYNFTLQDTHGKWVTLEQFRGKTVILDFWFTGCMGCIQLYKGVLEQIEKEKDSSFVVISICIDTDKKNWLSSIDKDCYTSHNAVNLTTGQLGSRHPVINWYGITAYPGLIMIDKKGRILHRLNTMRNADTLRELIKKAGEPD